MRKILALITTILLLSSCIEETYDYGYVNFYIDPESTEYFNLNYGNRGWEYFEGGMRGVVVFRVNWSEFVCYERSCPKSNCGGKLVVDETNNMLLHCPKCNSSFIYVDGSPTSGSSSKRSLYSYCTTFDGNYLWVYNCN
ncbi:MAG: hypothetical protein H6Q15_1935 [Bacteroidetes bacterium]|nr:hypothetical protein [Bacteroidota bacterium]